MHVVLCMLSISIIFPADVDKKFETYQKFISIVIRCHRSVDSRVIAIVNLLCLALYFVPLVFLEREIFLSLCPFPLCFCYLSGVLLIVGHWFIVKSIFAHAKFGTATFALFKTGCVHSMNWTNQSNWQRWSAGSVVSNEMRFSNRQHPGFRSCPFNKSTDSTGFIASLQLMRCNFPINNE